MADNPSDPLTPRDVCRIVLRHKWKALLVFSTIMAVVFALIVFAPRTYISEAKLFVRLGRENVSLDPTATTGSWLPIQPEQASQIASMVEVLNSRMMVERVVQIVGADRVLGKSDEQNAESGATRQFVDGLVDFAGGLVDSTVGWIRDLDPVSEPEEAVRKLMKRLDSYAPEGSSVVLVECKAKSPHLAQEVVATLVDVYMKEHVRINRTVGSRAFFAEQTELLSEQWRAARHELQELKNEMGMLSVDSHRSILQAEVMSVKTDLIRVEKDAAASEAQIAALRATVEKLPEKILLSETEGMPNSAADNMQALLYGLQIQEAEYSSKYVDGYAPLEAIRRQVALATDVLERQEEQRVHRTNAVNPVHQDLQKALLEEQARLESLKAEGGKLRSENARLQEEVALLNTRESRLIELEEQAGLLEKNYLSYSTKLEETRINEALENERISNVNLVEPATFIGRPVSPRKGTVLMLGSAFALAASLLVIAVAEFLDRTLQTPRDVERTLDLPVLMSVPRSSQARALLNCR